MPAKRLGPKLPPDLTGLRSEKLLITGPSLEGDSWLTQCDCGRSGSIKDRSFRKRESKRCQGRACIREEHLLDVGQRFGSWTVIAEDYGTTRERAYICQCSCGAERSIPVSKLVSGFTQRCSNCRKNLLINSHPYNAWRGLINLRPHLICSEWKDDFQGFLDEYLKVTGTEIDDHYENPLVFRPFRIDRPIKHVPYGPGNLSVVHMVTERAWDNRTYRQWMRLKRKNLLTPELADSYILFLNTFGTKELGYLLARKDYAEPHSAKNSFWIKI